MTTEQAALVAMAEESLRAARLPADQGIHRFSVSRAYYAMFYCAEALLLSMGKSYSKHSGVTAAFGLEFAKAGRTPPALHRFLIEASELREEGDYDAGASIGGDDSGEQILRAESFAQATREYLGSSGSSVSKSLR